MITPLYVALLGILFIGLSINVIRGRRKFRIALSDGGNTNMERRIRAHGNFAEYTPLFLIMLGYAELGGLPGYGVHLLGCLFTLGRLSHAYGIAITEQPKEGKKINRAYRVCGMVCTFLCLSVLAITLILQYLAS